MEEELEDEDEKKWNICRRFHKIFHVAFIARYHKIFHVAFTAWGKGTFF